MTCNNKQVKFPFSVPTQHFFFRFYQNPYFKIYCWNVNTCTMRNVTSIVLTYMTELFTRLLYTVALKLTSSILQQLTTNKKMFHLVSKVVKWYFSKLSRNRDFNVLRGNIDRCRLCKTQVTWWFISYKARTTKRYTCKQKKYCLVAQKHTHTHLPHRPKTPNLLHSCD